MKRYIKCDDLDNKQVIQLSELLYPLDMQIVFVDDFNLYNRSSIECGAVENYNDYTDDELSALDTSEIALINDIQVLKRIGKINRKLLTPAQKALVTDEYKKKVIAPKSTVKSILKDFKQKTYAAFMPYRNTTGFMQQHGITPDDALYAIQHLTIGDYVAHTQNIIPTYYGDELIIFEPTRALPLKNHKILTNVIIYVKVDLDLSQGDGVYLISFHDTDTEDYKPYR